MAAYIRCFPKAISKLEAYHKKICHGLSKIAKKNGRFQFKNSNLDKMHMCYGIFFWTTVNASSDIDKGNGQVNENEMKKERIVSHYISMAETAIKEGDMDRAEQLLNKALQVSNKSLIVGITCVYDMLATIAFKKGKISEATYLLEEVIAKLSKSKSEQDKNMVINFSLKLARLYENEGEFNLAELGFRNCVAIQKNKYIKGCNDEETTTLWINSLFWYGKFLAQRKRYSEAKQCFDSAYSLIPHVGTLGNEQAMVTLYNMGEMAFAIGDNEGALKHLLNAVLIGKLLKSSDLPIYYNKIGLVYLHRGVYNEAKRWCTNGLMASKRHHNKSIHEESQECLKEIDKLLSANSNKSDPDKTNTDKDNTDK